MHWSSTRVRFVFFFNDTATTEIYTLSLHDALPISGQGGGVPRGRGAGGAAARRADGEGRHLSRDPRSRAGRRVHPRGVRAPLGSRLREIGRASCRERV